jgi:anti-anti-sigma factor
MADIKASEEFLNKISIVIRYPKKGLIMLVPKGEITGDARFDLHDLFVQKVSGQYSNLLLDLTEVPMMDSVGLGMIVAFFTELSKQNGKIALLNVGRHVNYLLVVTKLDQIFEKYDDEQEAIDSFKT